MTKNYLIDTHAHINFGLSENGERNFSDEEVRNILQEMNEYGVKKVIIPAVDTKTLERVKELAEMFENVYGMIGIFPTEANTYSQEIENKMIEFAKSSKIVAVGEIGLDYYWEKETSELQKDVFIKQIKLANKLNLPIVVHDRDAHKDCFDIIKKYNTTSKVLFHCFSGSVEFMKECVKEGWYIAIGGVVTFKNAIKMKDVAREVPLNKLVLETDSPYLTPVPYRGKENKPAYVKFVAEKIAEIKGMNTEQIIEATTSNAEEFFRI